MNHASLVTMMRFIILDKQGNRDIGRKPSTEVQFLFVGIGAITATYSNFYWKVVAPM